MKNYWFFFIIFFLIFTPFKCYALQEHGAIEGLLAHQGAHILFFWAMCDFSYRLIKTDFFQPKIRKYFLIGSILLCIWNIWAFVGHILAIKYKVGPLIHEEGIIWGGKWKINGFIDLLYYTLKMDHLVLVPSIIFFFLASRSVLKKNTRDQS
ncbi:hypothetical protein DBT_1341 [Dissulfuribacter thermophilus]|uniref:Uncharacterized protein n=1 Tax=Dissulfuribacter thermophilus TaxID=1156395 RepID=A0A1B9F5J4_9BACT|nr:hypothetical protein DBT_1341 [Dissulfuribacter thermophilus]